MKCPHCNKAPFPIKDSEGNFIWKNFFRVDLFTVVAVGILLFLSWGYQHDIAECDEFIENIDDHCKSYCEANTVNNIGDDLKIDWGNMDSG